MRVHVEDVCSRCQGPGAVRIVVPGSVKTKVEACGLCKGSGTEEFWMDVEEFQAQTRPPGFLRRFFGRFTVAADEDLGLRTLR